MLHAALFAAALNGSVVAMSRCNDINILQMQDKLRKFEGSTPAPADRDARFAALQSVVQSAGDEAVILQSVCSDRDFAPLEASIQAIKAWSLVLQSDLAKAEYGDQCPAAQLPVVRGFVAEAWLNIAEAEFANPKPPSVVTDVEAKVRSRASADSLTLPSVADASSYWLTGIQKQGRDAAKACKQ